MLNVLIAFTLVNSSAANEAQGARYRLPAVVLDAPRRDEVHGSFDLVPVKSRQEPGVLNVIEGQQPQ